MFRERSALTLATRKYLKRSCRQSGNKLRNRPIEEIDVITHEILKDELNRLFCDLNDLVIKPALAPNITAPIKVTAQEGGEWIVMHIHSLEMPDGTQWDARNGWRNAEHKPEQAEKSPY